MNFSFNYILIFLIAAIPAAFWLYLFLRRQRANGWLVILTFIGGMLAARLILVYQGYWDETVNLIFFKLSFVDFRSNLQMMVTNTLLATFFIFLGVGVMEEFLKFWIMKFINHRFFKSIDDVIELAIISALGFAFFENILYFISQWGELSTAGFALFALFRVTVVTMVHVLCSAVLGYYYGMAFFASPMLKIQRIKQRRHVGLEFLKRVLHFSKSRVYHNEMMTIGLLSAMFLHAVYDFVLTIQLSIFGVPLYVIVMAVYFFGGYLLVSHLFEKKDLHLKLGLVGTHIMPKEDFTKLLDEVQTIKERMQDDIVQTPAPV